MDAIKILNDNLLIAKNQIILNMKSNGKWASGKTADSITVSDGEIHMPNWISVLEYGRKAGKQPPSGVLIAWAKSKGLTFQTESDLNRWAYLTARKIGNEGTEQYRNGQYLDIYDTPLYEAAFRAAEDCANDIEFNL